MQQASLPFSGDTMGIVSPRQIKKAPVITGAFSELKKLSEVGYFE